MGGKPLKGAGLSVSFQPADEKITPSMLVLKDDGTFAGKAPVGANKAFLVASGAPGVGHVAPTDVGIDPKYMTIDGAFPANVEKGKPNNFEFDVGDGTPSAPATGTN